MAKPFTFLLFLCCCVLAVTSADRELSDLVVAESIASKDYKVQSVAAPESGGKYGYPYMIAPTLSPRIQARSDDDDISASQEKPYGRRIASSDGTAAKKNHKKSKTPYGATRRQDGDDASIERRFMTYTMPKYRNFDELEAEFSPRRMDIDIPYSQYDYSSKLSSKPAVSPRDPYLSPSGGPVDTFYPTVPKVKSYSTSSYGVKKQSGPSYGAGSYDDSLRYHDDSISYDGPSSGGYPPSASYSSSGGSSPNYPSSGGPSSSYSSGGPSSGYSSGGPSSSYSSGGPSSSYSSGGHPPSYPLSGGSAPSYPSGGSSPSYPSSAGPYHYNDYAIKSHEPIMGNIRKKLLDYAGASDLYDSEPDYLREVSRNKYKYGNIGNDYYAYGGPGYRDTYRDFPYIESKISLIKKSRV